MTPVNRFSMLAIALATLATSAASASAETLWQYNHPRRAEVNERLAYQNYRIDRGVADGRISPYEARRLHAEDRVIRHEERFMARFNGGHISRAEQRALNQQENAVSRQIGR
jgi:prolyl oligopeptidase PreP (S9A serine peptidase family)